MKFSYRAPIGCPQISSSEMLMFLYVFIGIFGHYIKIRECTFKNVFSDVTFSYEYNKMFT